MFSTSRMKPDGDQKISRNLNMIKLFYQNKDYSTAKNYVTDLLTLKPDSSDAYKLLSQINEALGEHEQAMKNYKKSLELRVSLDQNTSFESNRQFTPTKVSSPLVSRNNLSVTPQQENHVNQMAYAEAIERLLERKLSTFEKMCESINHNIASLNENFNKNYEEVASIKKKVVEMQKKITHFATKQDELGNKLSSMPNQPPRDDADLKQQLSSFSVTINNLSNDNSKIIEELHDLKQVVQALSEKNNFSDDYDEDESYNDYENEAEEVQESGLFKMTDRKLGQLTKKQDNDSWKCSTCDTPNSNSDPACVCCETQNPNQAKNNGVVGQDKVSPFKFGAPSSGFSFGVPQATPIKPSSTFTPMAQSTNSPFVLPATGNTFVPPAPINLGLVSSSANSAFNPSVLPASSTSVVPSEPVKPIPAFGFNLSADSKSSNNGVLVPEMNSPFSFGGSAGLNFGTSTASVAPTKATTTFDFIPKKETVPVVTNGSVGQDKNSAPFSFGAFPSFSFGGNLPNANLNPSFPFNSTTLGKPETADIANSSQGNVEKTQPTNSSFGIFSSINSTPNFAPSKTDQSHNTGSNLGLFSSNTISLNNGQNKEDTNEIVNNDHMNDLNFVSEKSKLLPQNFELKTGEEDEEVLFNERSKMYHFITGEWKERGVGNMKILKRKETNAYRLLMRRDKILNVICNHKITEQIKLEPFKNSNNTLTWFARDYSEETDGVDELFALKFKTETIKNNFESVIHQINDSSIDANLPSQNTNANSEVELVYTKKPKPEHLDKIDSLKLPPNFYDYEDKTPCKGCIGCNVDTLNWSDLTRKESADRVDTPKPVMGFNMGLFSSIATDLNLTLNKVDSIADANEGVSNDHMNDLNFVSEKSKLLPQNFELKTGEEDEEILFNERSKIYHFVNGEWKERGVGNMKILKRKDTNAFRLLMRRDKILNVICNHKISEHLKLEPFQNSNNTLTWFARDFSEETGGLDELFALKFKNEKLMKQFEIALMDCIAKV